MDKGTDGRTDWPTDRQRDIWKYGQMRIERDRQPGKAHIQTDKQMDSRQKGRWKDRQIEKRHTGLQRG